MAITHEDITELKKVFDDRYVLQSDCAEIQEGIHDNFYNNKADIRLLQQGQSQNNKLAWGILIGVVCLVIEGIISKFI